MYAKNYPWHWHSIVINRHCSCPHETFGLVGETDINQLKTQINVYLQTVVSSLEEEWLVL